MNPETVAQFVTTWGYPAYAVLLLFTAVGSPFTEDLLLLVAGYLVSADVFSWRVVLPLSYIGVVGTDCIYYSYGYKLRTHSLRGGWIRRIIRPARVRLATRWFARFGDGLVFVARLVPGTRMVVFVSAGAHGVPLWRFVLLDALASALWVPLLLLAGNALGERIGGLHRGIEWVTERIQWLILLVVVGFVLRRLWIRRERQMLPPDNGSL
jgi:membrane protein DedA with SNARE-associated domain